METSINFGSNKKAIGEMTTGKIIRQQFVAKTRCISGLEIKVGTYQRKNVGNILEISIIDSDNASIHRQVVNPRTFNDNKMNHLSVNCNIEPGKKYILQIISLSGTKERSVTFIYGDKLHDCKFSINDTEMDGELYCSILFSDKELAIKENSIGEIKYDEENVSENSLLEKKNKTPRQYRRKEKQTL